MEQWEAIIEHFDGCVYVGAGYTLREAVVDAEKVETAFNARPGDRLSVKFNLKSKNWNFNDE